MLELAESKFSNLCRLCGEVDGVCLDLFEDLDQGEELLFKIENSIRISIQQNDGLPQSICTECHSKLLDCFSFYKQCHDTQERLKEFLCIESAIQNTNSSKEFVNENEVMIDTYDQSVESGPEDYFDEVQGENEETVEQNMEQENEVNIQYQLDTEASFNEDGSMAVNEEKNMASLMAPAFEETKDVKQASSNQSSFVSSRIQTGSKFSFSQSKDLLKSTSTVLDKTKINIIMASPTERFTGSSAGQGASCTKKVKLTTVAFSSKEPPPLLPIVNSKILCKPFVRGNNSISTEGNKMPEIAGCPQKMPSQTEVLDSFHKKYPKVLFSPSLLLPNTVLPNASGKKMNVVHHNRGAVLQNAVSKSTSAVIRKGGKGSQNSMSNPTSVVKSAVEKIFHNVLCKPSTDAPSTVGKMVQNVVNEFSPDAQNDAKTMFVVRKSKVPSDKVVIVKAVNPKMSHRNAKEKGRVFIMSSDKRLAVEICPKKEFKEPVITSVPFLVLTDGRLVPLDDAEKQIPLDLIPIPPVIMVHTSKCEADPPKIISKSVMCGLMASAGTSDYMGPCLQLRSGLTVHPYPEACSSIQTSSQSSSNAAGVLDIHNYGKVKSRESATNFFLVKNEFQVSERKRKFCDNFETKELCVPGNLEEVCPDKSTFQCKFSELLSYEQHTKSDQPCGKILRTQAVKSVNESILCSECGAAFTSLKSFKLHEQKHSISEAQRNRAKNVKQSVRKKVKCVFCNQSFLTLALLNEHCVSHTKDFCDNSCLKKDGTCIHTQVHENSTYFFCGCGKIYRRFNVFMKHKKVCLVKGKLNPLKDLNPQTEADPGGSVLKSGNNLADK